MNPDDSQWVGQGPPAEPFNGPGRSEGLGFVTTNSVTNPIALGVLGVLVMAVGVIFLGLMGDPETGAVAGILALVLLGSGVFIVWLARQRAIWSRNMSAWARANPYDPRAVRWSKSHPR